MSKFPKEFVLESNFLYCLLCTKQITFDKKHGNDRVKVHRETKKHQKNIELTKPQQLITSAVQNMEVNMNKDEF